MADLAPPISNEDRISHDRAVWREGRPDECISGSALVSVDYGDGAIEQTHVDRAAWHRAKRYRFGCPPA